MRLPLSSKSTPPTPLSGAVKKVSLRLGLSFAFVRHSGESRNPFSSLSLAFCRTSSLPTGEDMDAAMYPPHPFRIRARRSLPRVGIKCENESKNHKMDSGFRRNDGGLSRAMRKNARTGRDPGQAQGPVPTEPPLRWVRRLFVIPSAGVAFSYPPDKVGGWFLSRGRICPHLALPGMRPRGAGSGARNGRSSDGLRQDGSGKKEANGPGVFRARGISEKYGKYR